MGYKRSINQKNHLPVMLFYNFSITQQEDNYFYCSNYRTLNFAVKSYRYSKNWVGVFVKHFKALVLISYRYSKNEVALANSKSVPLCLNLL